LSLSFRAKRVAQLALRSAATKGGICISAVLVLAACTAKKPTPPQSIADDFGDSLVVGPKAERIVSLNPTATEILYAVGAGPRLVGRTAYDMFPAGVVKVKDLGPGLRPNVEAVLSTRPDLVVLYASESNRDAARRLRASGVRTATFRIDRIRDFNRVTRLLGELVGDTTAARVTVDSVNATLDRVRAATKDAPHPKVFWPFWESPILTVGGGSFVNEIIEIAGGRNIFADLPQPSPAVAFEELLRRDPDVLLTGPKTRAKLIGDARWRTLHAVRDGHVLVIDTTIVNGPGPRVGSSTVGVARLLHPELKF
jgi:ABC-type Fe3+-hydroxamate transport system substrate-binding protein